MLQGIYLDFLYINGISMIMFTKTLKCFQLDCSDISFDYIGGYSRTDKNGLVVSNIKKVSLKQKIFNSMKIAKKYQDFSDKIKNIIVINKSKTQCKFALSLQ